MSQLRHESYCNRVSLVLFLLLISPIHLSASPVASEHLEYTISYQGWLTGMARLDICDAVLLNPLQEVTFNGESAYKSIVKISSERHKKMEYFYPFRFYLTSYFSTNLQRSLLFDRHKKTRKNRHEIIQFDWGNKVTKRFKWRKSKQESVSIKADKKGEIANIFSFLGYDPVHFHRSGKRDHELPTNMLDRLSLLQAVRNQKLVVGEEKRFTISNGKEPLNYLVRVLKRDPLDQSGHEEKFIKVRFDAFDAKKWSGEPAHQPFFIWMTADKLQTPVRFSIDYAMGTFVAQLKHQE